MSTLRRRFPGGVVPQPPAIGQNIAQLPDGTIDPFHANDCGETCAASILKAATSYCLSPGCIRQALSVNADDGLTSASSLALFLEAMGLAAQTSFLEVDQAWAQLQRLRHHGRYAIILGRWIGPSWLHWYLAYEGAPTDVHVMDPWSASTVLLSLERFRALYAHAMVLVS